MVFTQLWIFPMTLSISNISLQKCYRESFTTNNHFPINMQKFSQMDVLPHTISNILFFASLCWRCNGFLKSSNDISRSVHKVPILTISPKISYFGSTALIYVCMYINSTYQMLCILPCVHRWSLIVWWIPQGTGW